MPGLGAALLRAICCCRKGGTVSLPGVYSFVDDRPMGAFINESMVMQAGQTRVHRYLKPLTGRIQKGEIDPSAIIARRLPLSDAPKEHETSREKRTAASRWC